MATWSKSVIDRPLTVMKGKLGAGVDLAIAHVSITVLGMTNSSTSEGLLLSGAYGVTDKIEVGASYGFSLHEFEIKGTLTPFAAMSLVHSDKLDVAAGLDLAVDLNVPAPTATDPGATTQSVTLEAGLGVRYKITPKIAAFTGSPFPGSPVGQHLKIGLKDNDYKTFDIPVGFGMQATPELFAYLTTNVATILLSDPGMGDRVSSIADITPLNVGGWFNVNKNIDAVATLSFLDVQHAGDAYAIFLGARYFN